MHKARPSAKYKCPKCKSGDVDIVEENILICLDCGYEGKLTI